ncbi:hypothetical protein M2322_004581 [Rhodoblastus acidophilus]|uniref:hypothetical protein n=1 Tax=Rhodoblastus acidophilus TaxID=1074 RepID=UPI002224CBFD|nr:hypothetical protein [Rhodoblastus acidophilus]MCW2319012.1 hypothetical protein [Rhodoblastus acidophilus]
MPAANRRETQPPRLCPNSRQCVSPIKASQSRSLLIATIAEVNTMLTRYARTAVVSLGLALTAPAAHAQAPSDEIILDYLKSIFTSIDVIDYKRVYEGALESLKDVVVIRYSLDYPTGGSEAPPKTSELEVLTIEDDRIKNIPVMPLPVGQVDNVSVRDGRIYVEARTFGQNDKPCCPSEPRSIVYKEADGVLTTGN